MVERFCILAYNQFYFNISLGATCKTFNVKTVTEEYGPEVSWDIGSCTNKGQFMAHNSATQTCCLPTGSHKVNCKDSFGDGWSGGFLEINGKQFCKEFTHGHKKTEPIAV